MKRLDEVGIVGFGHHGEEDGEKWISKKDAFPMPLQMIIVECNMMLLIHPNRYFIFEIFISVHLLPTWMQISEISTLELTVTILSHIHGISEFSRYLTFCDEHQGRHNRKIENAPIQLRIVCLVWAARAVRSQSGR